MVILPSWVPTNRLPFRIIYGVRSLKGHSLSPTRLFDVLHGEDARTTPGLGEAIAGYGAGEPPNVPSPVRAWSSFARVSESLGASDLGYVVVGEQALLAS